MSGKPRNVTNMPSRLVSSILDRKKTLICVAMSVLLTSSVLTPLCFALEQREDIESLITANEAEVAKAYEAVLLAHKAGANVWFLKEQLEMAAVLLGEANMAFGTGDYSRAKYLAENSVNMVRNVSRDADELRVQAEVAAEYRLLSLVVSTVAGLLVLSIASLIGWRLLKTRYKNEIQGMRPEIPIDEN